MDLCSFIFNNFIKQHTDEQTVIQLLFNVMVEVNV